MNCIRIGFLTLLLAASAGVVADEVVIQAGAREFIPLVVRAKPGDTIVWKSMNSHNTKSMDIPEGATAWDSKLHEDFHTTVDKEGAYSYVCVPHASFGMIGVIVVGDGKPANLDAMSQNTDAMGKRAYKKLVAWLKEQGIE